MDAGEYRESEESAMERKGRSISGLFISQRADRISYGHSRSGRQGRTQRTPHRLRNEYGHIPISSLYQFQPQFCDSFAGSFPFGPLNPILLILRSITTYPRITPAKKRKIHTGFRYFARLYQFFKSWGDTRAVLEKVIFRSYQRLASVWEYPYVSFSPCLGEPRFFQFFR